MASQILVTDATSFVSSHIIKQLSAEGHQVRGTVCSLQEEDERVKKLLEDVNTEEVKYKLEVVEADPAKDEGVAWEQAMKDVQFVIHGIKAAAAVPSSTEGEAPNQPAVDAVVNVFKACVAAKSVSRVVLTSSYKAIAPPPTTVSEKVFSESDWADADTADAMTKSIIVAEKAAWDFVKELTDADKIELVVINPTQMVGPAILDVQQDIVKSLMDGSMKTIAKVHYELVDVRDVAQAHVKALTQADMAGNRLLVHGANKCLTQIANHLSTEFKPQGYGVPVYSLPKFALYGLSLFNKNAKTLLPLVGKTRQFDNKKMTETMGITPKDVKDSVIEEAQVLVDRGLVKKTKKVKNSSGASAAAAATPADAAAEGVAAAKTEEAGSEKTEEAAAEDNKPAENGDVKEDGGAKTEEEVKSDGGAGDGEKKVEESGDTKKAEEEPAAAKSEEKTGEETTTEAAPAAEEAKAEN